MRTSAPIVDVIPQVREAFDEACVAHFKTGVQRPLAGRESHDLLFGFAAHYQQLRALPRRMRRSIERHRKCTLAALALLMALNLAPAWAATLVVAAGTPPSATSDGRCSLIEAIVNANSDHRTYADCAAGAGADTIYLPPKSTQTLGVEEALPDVTSQILIEGRDSTIKRKTSSFALPLLRVG